MASAWAPRPLPPHRGAHVAFGVFIALVLFTVVRLLAGCASTTVQDQAATAEALARVAETAGLEVARWQVAHTDCGGLSDSECIAQMKAEAPEWWGAWQLAITVYDAYATSLEQGTPGPSWELVLSTYCQAVRAMPEDGPRALVVPGACP